ncbi:MAG: hypothetical protein WDM87_12365 [Terracidiphilus sp.]
MELLIVMAIIAILSLLAIASISVYTKKANALSAVNSLQKIVQAQMMYEESYPGEWVCLHSHSAWRRSALRSADPRPAHNYCRRTWRRGSSRDTNSPLHAATR